MNFDDYLSVLNSEFTNAGDFQIWISYDVIQYGSFLHKHFKTYAPYSQKNLVNTAGYKIIHIISFRSLKASFHCYYYILQLMTAFIYESIFYFLIKNAFFSWW